MFRVDAAVDKADDDAVPIQAPGSAQSAVCIKQPEEVRAEIGCQRPDFVFPDVQDLRHVFEFVRLRGAHLGRESVEAIAVAVDLLRVGRGLHEQLLLLGAKPVGITLDCGTGFVETHSRRLLHGQGRGGLPQRGVIFRGRGRTKLNDVYLSFVGITDIRQLQASGDSRVAQRRVVAGIGAGRAKRQAKTGKKSDQFHGSSGSRQPGSPCQRE